MVMVRNVNDAMFANTYFFLSLPTSIYVLLLASLKNVDLPSLHQLDKMESFFLAETLKYLYLLFDPSSDIDILNKVRLIIGQLK